MKYSYVLFDADETLFRFDIMAGLTALFASYDIIFTEADYHHYQKTNKSLWLDYQDGKITAEYLQITRFTEWSKKLNVPAKELNDKFLDAMAEICVPLPGASSLLNKLHKVARLGIITNGFARMQRKRLAHTGFQDFFEWLVISEIVGTPKPDIAIFEHTFELMGHPPKEDILMVGDTASSDILGGMNAGIDTCWLQHPGEELPEGIKPTHQVRTLAELEALLAL